MSQQGDSSPRPHVNHLAGHLGRGLRRSLRRTIRGVGVPRRRTKTRPGATPGIEPAELNQLTPGPQPVRVSCIDYCPDHVQVQDISDLDAFVAQHRPAWSVVRWINVDGLDDPRVIRILAEKYQLHPLAIEDVLHVHQRPKAESYGGGDSGDLPRLFIVVRMIQLVEGHLDSEQVSIFLGRNTVLTFQQRPGDVWGPIRERIHKPGSRLRQNDASFLVYALLDAAVDYCFPTLEFYSDQLELLEQRVLESASDRVIHEIHGLKHELMLLRREIWPMRELIHHLQREAHHNLSETTRVYLRDVYDHTVQVIELVETYREVAGGLAETWMSAVSNRMNQVMKVLTLIATIFIPMTFLAGVYGMNFQYMPEIAWPRAYPWAYPIGFWTVCVTMAVGMLVWFRRRGWL